MHMLFMMSRAKMFYATIIYHQRQILCISLTSQGHRKV